MRILPPAAALALAATALLSGRPATAAEPVVITGTVTDGSGHGWPLHALVRVDGADPVWSDPVTGRYEIAVAPGGTRALTVAPELPGYPAVSVDVPVGSADVNRNVAVPVDRASCAAPGYVAGFDGVAETFDDTGVPAGWEVLDHTGTGTGWSAVNPLRRQNETGGDGRFMMADSANLLIGPLLDTDLISPPADLSGVTEPVLTLDTRYRPFRALSTADIAYSVDGGATWLTVWHQDTGDVEGTNLTLPLPAAADRADVRVRFHYTGDDAWYWQIDNVFLGTPTCSPVHGGLVVGHVLDDNTGAPLVDATVTGPGGGTARAGGSADPTEGPGYYTLFAPATGDQSITGAATGYTDDTRTVRVPTNATTRADLTPGAGHLTISAERVDAHVPMGQATTRTVTLTNDGTQPVSLTLATHHGGFGPLDTGEAPVHRVSGRFEPGWAGGTDATTATEDVPIPAEPWEPIADYPTTIMDNTVVAGADGRFYSFGGTRTGQTTGAESYVYDPGADRWTRIADLPHPRQRAAAAWSDGRIVVTDGWGPGGIPEPSTDVYDPATDTWSTAASVPEGFAAAGTAVSGGALYVVGGCDDRFCGSTHAYAFDLTAGVWSRIADYPIDVAWQSCAGVDGAVYCAGGTTDLAASPSGYRYDPTEDAWTPIAGLPFELWGSSYATANGMLVVSGGVTGQGTTLTNEGFAYDPATDTWTPIPNAPRTVFRAGGACGFVTVGGSTGQFSTTAGVDLLPGFDRCGGVSDLAWLSVEPTELHLDPGRGADVSVRMNAGSGVDQPGDYTADLVVDTDTPYRIDPIGVTMTAVPPDTWGEVTGVVTGVRCDGTSVPLAAVVVEVDSWVGRFRPRTDADGRYRLWLDWRAGPLTVIAAEDGWRPDLRVVELIPGGAVTADFALPATTCEPPR